MSDCTPTNYIDDRVSMASHEDRQSTSKHNNHEDSKRGSYFKWAFNRWTRSFVVYLGLLLLASGYSNWQPMFLILNDMGAYHWVCDENSTHEDEFAHCDQQYDYLTQIFSVATNMAAIFGLVGGIMMDSIGGRPTMALGVVVVYLGWLMLVFSNESVPMYWPGLIFLGAAENLLGFPAFLIREFWPKIQDTCASLNIAMQQLSSWMPIVLWMAVDNSTKEGVADKALIYFLLICLAPAVLMIVATPGKVHPDTPKTEQEVKSADYKTTAYWKEFGRLCLSVDFILFNIWYSGFITALNFYNMKIMEHAGQEVGELIGFLNPFRALFGPMMGVASDFIGAFPMIILDSTLLIVAFGVALASSPGAAETSAVFYILARSYCFTTKHIFVQHFYPKEHFGKLSGIISLVAGLVGFLNAWFQVLPYETTPEFIFCTIFSAIITLIPVYFLVKARKHKAVDPSVDSIDLADISSSSKVAKKDTTPSIDSSLEGSDSEA